MAKMTTDEAQRLENELISIFHNHPRESYRDALARIHQRLPDLKDMVTISDLNYRVPKLRRAGKIPASKRGARGSMPQAGGAMHPVARAYEELEVARQAAEDAQRRFEQAEEHLRTVLTDSLPTDFLHKLVRDHQ